MNTLHISVRWESSPRQHRRQQRLHGKFKSCHWLHKCWQRHSWVGLSQSLINGCESSTNPSVFIYRGRAAQARARSIRNFKSPWPHLPKSTARCVLQRQAYVWRLQSLKKVYFCLFFLLFQHTQSDSRLTNIISIFSHYQKYLTISKFLYIPFF